MLGEEITDAVGVEQGGTIKGMGLLPVRTVFEQEKTRTRVGGHFKGLEGMLSGLNGTMVEGYEIHMGTSILQNKEEPILVLQDAVRGETVKTDGVSKGNVYGCYIHGVFDRPEAAKGLIGALLTWKGLEADEIKPVNLAAHKEEQYDKLADIIRESLDMKAVYEILRKGNNTL